MRCSKCKIVVVIMCILLLLMLASCDSQKKYEYYSNTDHYTAVSGTISYINLSDDEKTLYVAIDNMSIQLSDNCFKIIEENLRIIQNQLNVDEIQIGDQVTLITAPRIFGDGYIMPAVSIAIEGHELLRFEDGVNNLLSWLDA